MFNTLHFYFFNFRSTFYIFYCYYITVFPIFPLLPASTQPTPCSQQSVPMLLSMFMGYLYMFFDYTLLLLSTIIPLPLLSGHCRSVPCFHACDSILLISLFCSLDSSSRWDHMVFVFHQLAYFTWHNIL